MSGKILLWDIESGPSLFADFGIVLCIGWSWATPVAVGDGGFFISKPEVRSLGDYPHDWEADPHNDKPLLKWFIENVWSEADYSVTWYGRRARGHDEPFVKTRALLHQLPPMKPIPSVDLWSTARTYLKLQSNRMTNVESFLFGNTKKTPIVHGTWMNALLGPKYPQGKAALKYIVDHCVNDIMSLHDVFRRMAPYVPNFTPTGGERRNLDGCSMCGGYKLEKRGYYYSAQIRRQQRVRCTACGKWDTRSMTWQPTSV